MPLLLGCRFLRPLAAAALDGRTLLQQPAEQYTLLIALADTVHWMLSLPVHHQQQRCGAHGDRA